MADLHTISVTSRFAVGPFNYAISRGINGRAYGRREIYSRMKTLCFKYGMHPIAEAGGNLFGIAHFDGHDGGHGPEQFFFALGQFLGEIISPFLTPLYMQTSSDHMSWKDLQSSVDMMSARNPDLRLSPRNVLGTTFFKDNVLIDIVETFKEIQGIRVDIKKRLFR